MSAGIDYSNYLQRRKSVENPIYTPEQINDKRRLITYLIKNKVGDGRYPSVQDIQRTLKLNFFLYFKNIREAYKFAKVKYQRPSPIILGKNKEIVLTKIIIDLFKIMNYEIERISIYDKNNRNKLEDLRLLDQNNQNFLVELKAYRKEQPICRRETSQLKGYMDKQNIKKGIFITTSNIIYSNDKNINIINGNQLISLLKEYNLSYYIEKIHWIQNAKVNIKPKVIKNKN